MVKEIAADLRAQRVVEAVWLIGSLAWGAHGAHSDVDVVVAGVGAADLTGVAARFVERLGDDVDVLRVETLSETFRQRVLEEGIRLDEP